MHDYFYLIWNADVMRNKMQEACERMLSEKVSLSLTETINNFFVQVEKHFFLWFLRFIGKGGNLTTLGTRSSEPPKDVAAVFAYKLAAE
jgi:hypothetical protein